MALSFREIYIHSLVGSAGKDVASQALSILRPVLPTSLPLYRRLQIGRFFKETVLLTNLPSLELPTPSNGDEQQWYLAFLDRTSRPETEIWMYCSWESDSNPPNSAQEDSQNNLVRALLQKIRTLPLPESHHQEVLNAEAARLSTEHGDGNVKDSSGLSRSDYSSHLHNPSILLLGAIHEKTAQIIHRTGLNEWGEVPNHTFIFSSLPSSLPAPQPLPANLHWGQLQHSDYALVRTRTQIPRQERTLAFLPQLAILTSENKPVAWAFVGLDGSLTTLHVEAEYRGQGLAKAITVKLFAEKMETLWEEGIDKMAHGYVVNGNDASSSVCKSLNGRHSWEAYWIRVNLERV